MTIQNGQVKVSRYTTINSLVTRHTESRNELVTVELAVVRLQFYWPGHLPLAATAARLQHSTSAFSTEADARTELTPRQANRIHWQIADRIAYVEDGTP
jgi:hypothetical protein